MKDRILAILLLLSVCIAGVVGCSTMEVESDYDQQAAFQKYKTYAWLPADRAPASSDASKTATEVQSLTDRRAKDAIDSELHKHGLQTASAGKKPDFYVSFDTQSSEWLRSSPMGFYNYDYYGSWCSYGYARTWSPAYASTIQIVFVDPVTKQTLWHGIATSTDDDQLVSKETVEKAVREMLAEYPPKTEH